MATCSLHLASGPATTVVPALAALAAPVELWTCEISLSLDSSVVV
jgi:hypothetical protein